MPISANDPSRLNSTELAATAASMAATIGTGMQNNYSVPGALVSNMAGLGVDLAADNAAVESAYLAYKEALAARDVKIASCRKAISVVTAAVFAVPQNTPSMIAALGLKPRSTSRMRIVPQRPMNLTALPSDDGSVLLKWSREGNPSVVVFQIEASDDSGDWRIIGTTTRASLRVLGFRPGLATSFRITATKNGLQSTPSPEVAIYPAKAALRVVEGGESRKAA